MMSVSILAICIMFAPQSSVHTKPTQFSIPKVQPEDATVCKNCAQEFRMQHKLFRPTRSQDNIIVHWAAMFLQKQLLQNCSEGRIKALVLQPH